MEGGWGAGMQRAGLVGDQMSSQWGRNVEEGERYRKQSSSQQSPCPVQEHMLKKISARVDVNSVLDLIFH